MYFYVYIYIYALQFAIRSLWTVCPYCYYSDLFDILRNGTVDIRVSNTSSGVDPDPDPTETAGFGLIRIQNPATETINLFFLLGTLNNEVHYCIYG